MHKEILTEEQATFLPFVKFFSKDFGLVGGTAIALHVGHRESVDFDLFTDKEFNNISISNKVKKKIKIERTFINKLGEFTFISNNVKFTFFHYPFNIEYADKLDNIIKLPDLLTLAAMKAYALGHRAKWKDYVDLYFIMKDYFDINKIIQKANELFSAEFNEKIFRAQLAYFKDVNYTEKVVYLKGFEVDDKIIEKKLIEFSLKQ
jgi:hypothetical protein